MKDRWFRLYDGLSALSILAFFESISGAIIEPLVAEKLLLAATLSILCLISSRMGYSIHAEFVRSKSNVS